MNVPGLPNPPTDNLYKFMAIFGLVILVLSVLVPWVQAREYTALNLEVVGSFRVAEKELEFIQDDLNQEATAPGNLKEIMRRNRDNQLQMAALVQKIDRMAALETEATILRIGAVASGIVGVVLMVSGFALWYKRLQRYQDMIVKRDSQKSA